MEDVEIERDLVIDTIRGAICGVGIFGNVMVLFVNLVLKEYEKNVTNWYVLQLATADLLCLATLPFEIAEDLAGRWAFPNWTCKVKEIVFFVNYFASVMVLLAMSVDRYMAVCRSFSAKIQTFRTKRTAVVISVIIWVMAIGMSIPIMLFSVVNGFAPYCKCRHDFTLLNKRDLCAKENMTVEACDALMETGYCIQETELDELFSYSDYAQGSAYEDEGSSYYLYNTFEGSGDSNLYNMGCSYADTSVQWRAYIYSCFAAMFFIPFLLMTISYCCIVFKIRRSGFRTNGAYRRNSRTASTVQRNRNKVTIVCFTLVLVFLVCWCPFYAVHLAKMAGIHGTTEYCMTLTTITSVLAYSNSAINPYIYNFFGTSFTGRIRKAATSVKSSLKLSSSSFNSDAVFGMRHIVNRRSDANHESGSATASTKFYRGKRARSERD